MNNQLPNNKNFILAEMDSSDLFRSYDLGACAALVALGFDLILVDKTSHPKKALFVFRNENGIEEAVSDYWADKLSVGAQSMFNAIKMLKNRIYSE